MRGSVGSRKWPAQPADCSVQKARFLSSKKGCRPRRSGLHRRRPGAESGAGSAIWTALLLAIFTRASLASWGGGGQCPRAQAETGAPYAYLGAAPVDVEAAKVRLYGAVPGPASQAGERRLHSVDPHFDQVGAEQEEHPTS